MTEQIIENSKVLCAAVKNGSLKIVEDLLKDGVDVNTIDDTYGMKGVTLLHSAVLGRQLEMVKLLIRYGSNVNVKNSWGITPLDNATENWYIEIEQLLLINGAKKRKGHPSPIFSAVKNGSLEILEDLLKDGVDVNLIDDDSYSIQTMTPLHSAVQNRKVEIVKLLINYGANVNIKNKSGVSPIADALLNKHKEMVELLLTNGADTKEDTNILYAAVEYGCLKFFEGLLKDGADVNRTDSVFYTAGMTLLHSVVESEQVEMAQLLINYGANINIKDRDESTPLVIAIKNWDTEMIKLLLMNGAGRKEDPNILSAAVMIGSVNMVEELLKEGAYVNTFDDINLSKGMTLLHSTVAWSQVERVKLLIKYGADVNAKDDNGATPIDYAILNGNIEIIDLLLTNGADLNDDLKALYAYDDNYECHGLTPTIRVLKHHIAMMKAAGLYVSEKNLLWISNDNEINDSLKRYEAEIEILKSEKIDNSCATFYDILTKNINALAKNENIVQALKSDDYKKRFPVYAGMIESRFMRGVMRKELLEQVKNKFLPSLSESLNKLPILCTEKIYSYLTNLDLRILLLGCELFNKHICI